MKLTIKAFLSECEETINKFWEALKKGFESPDRRKHFTAGVLISLAAGTLTNCWIGFLAGCVAGAAKEWRDSRDGGTVEWADFAFTALGAACATPFAALFHVLIF